MICNLTEKETRYFLSKINDVTDIQIISASVPWNQRGLNKEEMINIRKACVFVEKLGYQINLIDLPSGREYHLYRTR